MTLGESYRWSAALARREARNFYYSFRLLPREKHRAICAVYAFFRLCDDLADEPGATAAALDRWRGDLHAAIAGRPPDHPLWPGFADAVARFAIPHHVFDDMIDGMISDLEPRSLETWDELYRYCYQVASVVGIAVIHIFGFEGARAPLLAEKCGVAFQLTNILRDVKEDLERGRVYLPGEDRLRFGVAQLEDGPALRALLEFEADRARALYSESRPLLAMIHPSSRAAMRALMDIYSTLLARITDSGYAVMDRRIRVSGWEKAALTIRALLER
ncbi:MAG: phytoene/squalene synthase family protein [Bryobacteraceae bacterium]|nr:phytoene/squalene synthase family protein [Bryobacteraceae bacterium]